MLRETKFGYGSLMVGTGLPYLIDKPLGLAWAIFVSVTFVVVGGAFLCAGHRQRGEQAGPAQNEVGLARVWLHTEHAYCIDFSWDFEVDVEGGTGCLTKIGLAKASEFLSNNAIGKRNTPRKIHKI